MLYPFSLKLRSRSRLRSHIIMYGWRVLCDRTVIQQHIHHVFSLPPARLSRVWLVPVSLLWQVLQRGSPFSLPGICITRLSPHPLHPNTDAGQYEMEAVLAGVISHHSNIHLCLDTTAAALCMSNASVS